MSVKGTPELKQDLTSLSGGKRGFIKAYYEKKVTIFLIILTVGIIVAAGCGILFQIKSEETVIEVLERPGHGEGDRTERLQVQLEGEPEERELEVSVRERSYTAQEKEHYLEQALAELEQMIVGENPSLDEVRSDLNLPDSLAGGAVSARWMTVPYGVVDSEGRLTGANDEEGTLVEIEGMLNCDGQEAVYTVYAMIFPPRKDTEEKLQQAILQEVEKADQRDSYGETVNLPREIEGRKVIWKKENRNPFAAILAMTLILAVCVYIQMDNEVHKRAEARKQQLLLDYPDLMWKMTMLLGAGLSIRGTFVRISEEYLREKERKSPDKKIQIRYVYEEVVRTCTEMQSGISEGHAYERFGKRCQLPEYIRLGTVLSQNQRKGSRGLIGILEAEADASLTDRRNNARKIGEKAGTRLLLPMILMLGVVLAVLMVPAFLSF